LRSDPAMDLGHLRYHRGSKRNRKRVGRGEASGHGGTSGRGHKGALSRSGASRPAWFEGGQMPLIRRVPKRGFRHAFKKVYQVVNVGALATLGDVQEVTPEVLYDRGLVSQRHVPVKILGDGELSRGLHVVAHAFSQSAITKIEGAGGKVTRL